MTLRARLTLILLATLVPLGIVVGSGLYVFVRGSLLARLDDVLGARAEALAEAVKFHTGALEFDPEDAATPQYQPGAGTDPRQVAYFEIRLLRANGSNGLIGSSPSLGSASLMGTRPVPQREETWNADVPGSVGVRVLARRSVPIVEPDESQPETHGDSKVTRLAIAPIEGRTVVPEVLVVVAISRSAVDGPLEVLAVGLLCAGAVLWGVGWFALRWAIVKGLAPVSALAEQVAAIDATSLGSRLDVDRLPPEVAPIQTRVNGLLTRIESAMQRERRFTTAAAHELRTPVAELRTLLEVSIARPRTAEEAGRTIATSLASVERLDRLVSTLLRLARIEAGREAATGSALGVAGAIEAAIAAARPLADARRARFVVEVPPTATVHTDRDLFGLALANLVANAAEYADEGSAVTIALSARSAGSEIKISNVASALSTADLEQVGEPLWRADQAGGVPTHLGLGLTLARAALVAAGATMSVRVERGEATVFSVYVQV